MVPVVVLSAGLNSLGVVRSLKSAGMPIYLVSTTRWCAAAWSRQCRHVRFSSLRGRQLIEELKSLAARLNSRPVLILNGDREVATVSAHRSEIEPLYRISLPRADMVTTLTDKTRFQTFAEREGFPVPRAVTVTNRADLGRLRELALPVVIKPADKTRVLHGYIDRAVRAETPEQAREICERMLGHCAVLVQEWIDGEDSDIYFCLFVCGADSRPVGVFCGRKLVCEPPRVGSTALCVEATEVASELVALTAQFTARTHYKGLGSIEVKRDRKNGRFIIVEPTVGRTDWQEEIATLCGTNIPVMAYWSELGQPVPAAREPAARRWPSVAWRSSIGFRPSPGSLLAGARVVDGYFRMGDPLPGIYHYLIEELARRALRRANRWLRRPRVSAVGTPVIVAKSDI
jgi:D-aspartate ligase